MTNEEYWESLGLTGWKLHSQKMTSGGQAHVMPVKSDSGVIGVFRYLKDADKQAAARFARELEVLVDPLYQHPAIVEILEYSRNVATDPWYISRWGKSFRDQWKGMRSKFRDTPDDLVYDTVNKIRHLCAGLARLHDKGIVHRDIKLANVVASPDGNPVLIDFGVAYARDAPRLTEVNETVGNRIFSPDLATVPMEEVPPWIDVFQLAQMFMWMTSVQPDRDWQRPLHWRYVNYQSGLSNDLVLAIRAVTAACSQPHHSPKDAGELDNLMRRLFFQSRLDEPKTSSVEAEIMSAGAAKGEASKLLRAVERRDLVEVSLPLFTQAQNALSQELKILERELKDLPNPVIVSVELRTLGRPTDSVRNPDEAYPNWPLFELTVRAENGKSFRICVGGHLHLPPLLGNASATSYPPTSHPYMFELSRKADATSAKHFPERGQLLTMERNGDFILRAHGVEGGGVVDLGGVRSLLRFWVTEEMVWQMLYERD